MNFISKLLICACTFMLPAVAAMAQDNEMADVMRSNGKIYVVVGVLSIILLGIIIYLISLDKKIQRVEKERD